MMSDCDEKEVVARLFILLDASSQANNLKKKLVKQCVDTVSDRAQGV